MNFNIGVIGATGFIGTPYRREIREAGGHARIVALCARRIDRLQAAAREDGAELVTQDWREVVGHPDVNLVLVLTPDALHFEPVMACAARGLHVVCEKPVGVNVQQAQQIWAAYREAGLGHFVPFWIRYVAIFQRARQLVTDGVLGEIKVAIYRWHNPRPALMPLTWRDDAKLSAAGSLADVGSHAYDTLRWILGREAQRVLTHADTISPPKPDLGAIDLGEALQWGESHDVATGQPLRKGTTADYATIAFQFDGGTVGTMVLSHTTYLRKGLAPELELHGTEASLGVDRVGGRLTIAKPGSEPEILETLPQTDPVNRFAAYVFPAITARAQGSGHEHPGLDDGLRVQQFTDAAALSAKRGEWVDLAELRIS